MAEERVSVTLRARDLTKRALAGVRARMNRLRKAVFSLKGAMAGLGAAFAAGKIGQNLIKSFVQQQDAVTGLGAALQQTGKTGSDALQQLVQNASELQRVTRQGDEAIIAATESLTLMAPALDTAELERAQQAIIGLGEGVFKGDIQSAAQMLGKTIGGTTNALTRYGIEVDMSGSASERLNEILEESARYFEVAKDKTKTAGGSIQQLSNAFGDLKESLGGILADMLQLTDRSAGLTEQTFGLIDAVEQNRTQIVAWGRVALRSVGFVAQAFKTLIRVAFNVGEIIGRSLEIMFSGMIGELLGLLENVIQKPINFLVEQLNKIPGVDIDFRIGGFGADAFLANAAAQTENLKGDINDLGETLGNLAGSWQSVSEAAGRAWQAQSGAASVTPDVTPGVSPAVEPRSINLEPIAIPMPQAPEQTVAELLETKGFEELEAAAGHANKAMDQMAVTVINAFSQMRQAAQSGSGGLLSSLFGGASSILAAIPGVGTVASAGIMAGGGLLSSLFAGGGGNRVVPVTLDSYSSKALEQRSRRQGPDQVTVQIMSPSTGELLDEIVYEIGRRERRDAIVRIPGLGGR